jgi:uncharacterized protein
MKRIVTATILLLAPLMVMAYTSPGKPQGYVSDFAKVMSAADIQNINGKLAAFESSTGDQIAVVTVPSIGNDETIETYATKLFAEWGIGKKGNDNGLLILVSPNDRQVRIEVGYGLEGNITDLISNNIIQQVMIPAFKTGDYSAGISGAVDAVVGVISNSADASQYLDSSSGNTSQNFNNAIGKNIFVFLFIAIMLLNILARILGKTKSWWLGGVVGAVVGAIIGLIFGFVSAGIIAIVILTVLGLVFDFIVSKHPPGSGPGKSGGIWPIFFGGGGSGGSGFGGGGGFGGFGGGMSGGGGSSGRW